MNTCLKSIPLSRLILSVSAVHHVRKAVPPAAVFCNQDHANNFLSANSTQRLQCRQAGSSKWSNIKDTKMSKDVARGALFSKIAMRIKMSLKDGSANPAANVKLAEALESARKHNMPKASVNAITEKCQKSMENAKEYFLEYRGLDGVCLLIQLYTDNPKRGKGFVNVAVKRTGVSETKNTGSVRHVFEEKGLILAAAKIGNKKISLADAEEHAIEAEAEEVEHLGDNIQFLCDPKELHSVKTRLKEFGYDIESSELEFLPRSPIELDENGMQALSAIIERIEDIEDVLKVYPNIV